MVHCPSSCLVSNIIAPAGLGSRGTLADADEILMTVPGAFR
jgi:hypothetical protein